MNIEPEEIVERGIVAHLANALPDDAIDGALTPAQGVKSSRASHIGVTVDLSEQMHDLPAPFSPCVYSVRVSVRTPFAYDPTGAEFRTRCAKVRRALLALTGDGCAALEGAFECHALTLDSTSTEFADTDDVGFMVKTYNLTVTGVAVLNDNND